MINIPLAIFAGLSFLLVPNMVDATLVPTSHTMNYTVAAIPVPVVTITANPTSGTVNVVHGILTWSATNSPTSCTASGDWSGSKATSGTNVDQGVLTQVRTYTYTLTCSNAGGPSAPASATVVVNSAVNQSPVVNAGGDQQIYLPQTSTSVSGSASDPDGTIASTTWSQIAGPVSATISVPSSLSTSITGMSSTGIYTFRLTATDNQGANSTDDMNIVVSYVSQCSDGLDNDRDSFIDYPADPGCNDANDDDETDIGGGDPQCNDAADNDGDGFKDYPNDPGCYDLLDNDETDIPSSPTADIFASPNPISLGSSTTLTWSSTNSDYCTSNFFGGNGSPSGTQLVTPLVLPSTYTITCANISLGQQAFDQVVVSATAKKQPIIKEQ